MPNTVKIFALGGLDEDGKNCYVIEINNDIFVIESGMKFPDANNTGIDMLIPDVSYLVENKDRVKGYFISHGHDDIMGSLPYIIQKVPAPVYCSVNTKYMINLTTRRLKQPVNYDYKTVKSGDKINIAGHEVYFFSTTHSARDSLGIAIESGDGLIVYTGDFLFDYEALSQYRTDVNLLARLGDKKVLALMTESIACNKEGHASPYHKMTPVIEPLFKSNPEGRIYISIYYQNVFGIREALDMAVKYNRKVYLYGQSMKEMLRDTVDDYLKGMLAKWTINEYELSRPGNENCMVLVGGQGGEVFEELSKMASGENRMFTIKPKDAVIIASPEVPGLEVFGTKVLDEIYKTGAKILHTKKAGVISMHARAEDIKMMISLFKPKYYIPVKGQYQNLLANAKIAMGMNLGYNFSNIFITDNGKVGVFEDGEFKGEGEEIKLNDIVIDGLMVGDVVSSVIHDREVMGDEGVVVLGIVVDSETKTIIGGPDIQMRGLIYIKDSDSELIRDLATLYNNLVQENLNKGLIHNEQTRVTIHERLSFLVKKYTGKDPLVLPVITDIKQ